MQRFRGHIVHERKSCTRTPGKVFWAPYAIGKVGAVTPEPLHTKGPAGLAGPSRCVWIRHAGLCGLLLLVLLAAFGEEDDEE